jgi:hypothetical protein
MSPLQHYRLGSASVEYYEVVGGINSSDCGKKIYWE